MTVSNDSPYARYGKAGVIHGNGHFPERDLPVDLVLVDSDDQPRWESLFLRSYLRYLPLSQEELQEMCRVMGKNSENVQHKRQQVGVISQMLSFYGRPAFDSFPENIKSRLEQIKKVLDLNWQKFTEDKDTACVIAVPIKDKSKWPKDMLGSRDIIFIDKKDKESWQELFLVAYLNLKKPSDALYSEILRLAGGLQSPLSFVASVLKNPEILDDLNANLELKSYMTDLIKSAEDTWGKISEKNSDTIKVEIPSKDRKFLSSSTASKILHSYTIPPLEEHEVIGICYAAICQNMSYGKNQAVVEGTYVPNDYRSRGVGSNMLSQFYRLLKQDYGVEEGFFWTHKDNYRTQGIYPNMQVAVLDETLGTVSFKAVHTDEEMFVVGLNEQTVIQYKKIGKKEDEIADLDPVMLSAMEKKVSGFSVAKITEASKADFERLYKGYLAVENQEFTKEKFDRIWSVVIDDSSKTEGFFLRDSQGKPVGISFLQSDIKLPRDSFLTARLSIFIEPEERSMGSVRKLISEVCTKAANNKSIGAVRWILQKNDPHLPLSKVELEVAGNKVKPIKFPFDTYRMPMSGDTIYKGPTVKELKKQVQIE